MNDFDKYIAGIYRDMELHLIASMKRNLARHITEETNSGLNYPQWQAQKLKELKRYQRQNKKIIQSYTQKIPDEIAQQMKLELRQGSRSQIKLFKKALASGYKTTQQMKDGFFSVSDEKVSSLINALTSDLKTADTAILRQLNDVYRSTIFRTEMFAANGVLTEKQAYDMAVNDFLKNGVNCIIYRNGRRVNIADYASMAIRTASQRAFMVGEGEFRKSIGETLVIVSRHKGTCEYCAPFENKVLIDDVYSGGSADDGDYMLLSEAMKLGLYHPRCRHGINTYYPELEELNHYDKEDNRLNEYDVNPAHAENMIQRYRRLATGSIDPDTVAKYRKRIEYWENQLFTNESKRDIINQRGMYRASVNKGVFSVLPERMSKKHIRALAKEFDIDLTGLTLNIDTNEELLNVPFSGRADHENIGGITFFPNAFRDKETLLRTLIHEKQHVLQFKKYGVAYVQANRPQFEALAYAVEDEFIKNLKKGGKL